MSPEGLFMLLRAAGVLLIIGGPALLAIGAWGGGRLTSKDFVGAAWLVGFGFVLIWVVGVMQGTA